MSTDFRIWYGVIVTRAGSCRFLQNLSTAEISCEWDIIANPGRMYEVKASIEKCDGNMARVDAERNVSTRLVIAVQISNLAK